MTKNIDNFTKPSHFNFEKGEYIYNKIFKLN